ncbi:esterase family protein [Actinoallomurus purpureus]|uniref:alpha/beta hydrolase n=1 Tax=Actinoallomurus purpureus TaxID=478114 RepID=UPI00209351A0|nr:alpha/beta hydrolase-fold protein [Actinoallomurus purpureus]MCO6009644.1 esterase family protein [Actinoallomurus purpureus]
MADRYVSPKLVSVVVLVLAAVAAGCGSRAPSKAATPPTFTPSTAGTVPGTPGRASALAMPTGPRAHFTVARRTSAGPILLTRLTGARSGVTGKVWVWLPPQYDEPGYARTGFPVIILHTGGTGAGYNYWADPSVLPTQADDVNLARAGRAHPFIMVMPVLQLWARQDTECSDIPGRAKMGTWLGQDVPAFVRANFRTLRSRDGWGAAGASSGAFCAVKLAVEHPDEFKAAVSWGGYFSPETDLRWSVKGRRANSPDLILKRTRPDIRLLLLAGGAPRFRADVDRMTALTRLIRRPTLATTYVQPGGGHYTEDLKKLVPRILEFLTANLRGPVTG